MVEGTGVTRRFGNVTALDGATFRIGPGITGLLGANGAGKTTLLGLLLGLHRPDEGRLRVLDLDPITAGPEVRSRVGYSPEHHLLPPDTRAHDLVRHLAEIHGLPRRAATARASDALWQVGLGEERYRPIGTMSTGQRQRVKLAQAIAHDPALVLLDEPTDGLDPVQRDDMLALIRRVGTEFGIHVVISSHLLDEVERICDAAVILRGGTVVASGPLDELTGQGTGLMLEVDARPDAVAALLRDRRPRRHPRRPAPVDHRAGHRRRGARDRPPRCRPRRRGRGRCRRAPHERPDRAPGRRLPGGRGMTAAQAPEPGPTTGTQARILDRGYRAYTGPRLGVRGAVRSLVLHSMQRALGLKRPFWQKILPALAVFIAYVPAIVFVGLAVFLSDTLLENTDLLPTYADYYGFISAAIVVFTAFVAPELLCTDRRTGMLGLYLASPLTRDTYLLAKAIATVALLALVTLGPPLFLLIGLTIVGQGPDGPLDLLTLLGRIVLGGLAVAVLPGIAVDGRVQPPPPARPPRRRRSS